LTGLPEHAERLLEDDRLLMVFPEGARGTAKLFRERYSLVDFGSGFVRLALRTKSPIVPVAVLGGGEAFPTIANAYKLGRALGAPYLPIVAYGLPLPLPAKIEIQYGAPMHFAGTGNEEEAAVRSYVESVKEVIGEMVLAGARRRRGEPPLKLTEGP
jgi:1-acyl-sn-glycerol-3-phosphate acyltransferase